MIPHCVITTINAPSATVQTLAERCPDRVIVVGDMKTPERWEAPGVDYYSIHRQPLLELTLWSRLSFNHYARKNLGYLQAIRLGAECIYDTDDDNVPSPEWHARTSICEAHRVLSSGWCNVYRYFHSSDIWPRGFGLSHLADTLPILVDPATVRCPIQQGVADGEPDVDAIWRLAAVPTWMRNRSILFRTRKSIILGSGVWCPFNSQSTWWFREAFPLMYLPSHATFRMTDIWRSFVAQRCLWELGYGVAFHSPSEVVQDRNEHDLMKDFADEVPGYLSNEKIAATLEKLPLKAGSGAVTDNLVKCYEALVAGRFLPFDELVGVAAWVADVEKIRGAA